MGSREKIFEVRGPKSLTCADPTPIAKLTGQSEGDESFPSRGAKVEERRECAIECRHYDTHYTLETMFAMTSLVGTPVVATPARATRAVRSTETVAIFKKGAPKAAPKKGAKKVRPKPVHRRIRHRRGPYSPGVILRRARARQPTARRARRRSTSRAPYIRVIERPRSLRGRPTRPRPATTVDKIPRPRATVPALRWQRVTYPLTRKFPRPRSLSNALRRRRPSASGSSTPPCATPAPSARATRTTSRTAVSRAARRSKPVGSPARRQRAPVASGSSREDSSVRSRALGRTREPPARLVDVNEMNPFRLYPGVRSSPSASRARFDATRERLALSSRKSRKSRKLRPSFHAWYTRTS